MTLPIAIGKNSNNDTFITDLAVLPHLFLSYCYEAQIRDFFSQLVERFTSDMSSNVRFAIASTHSKISFDVSNGSLFPYCYLSKDEYRSAIHSKIAFLLALSKELQLRKRLLSSKGLSKFGNKISAPLLILLDDVLDIVISSKKSIGLIFLQLLLTGHQVNMHVIAASVGTCRNLLRQLMHINPLIKERFSQLFKSDAFSMASSLGAELIFTAEDFIFFKEAQAFDFYRLYPIVSEKITHEELVA